MGISGAHGATAAMAHHQSVTIAAKAQNQQKLEGQAAVSLIAAAGQAQSAGPAPDGTGTLINRLA